MTAKSNVKGRVADLSEGQWVKAFLYNFKADSHELRPEHKKWLEDQIWQRAAVDTSNPDLYRQSNDYWAFWLCGTASRTGNFQHNWALSRRRAKAVETWIEQQFRDLRFRVKDFWTGEALSAVQGHPDKNDDPMQRAVIIAARLVKGDERPIEPPPLEKPKVSYYIPCCYAYQLVALGSAAQESWVPELGGVARGGSPKLGLGNITAQPDRNRAVVNLKSWGFSNDRAWELYRSHSLFKCKIDQVDNHYRNRVYPAMLDGVRYALKCVESAEHNLCGEGSTIHFGQPLSSNAKKRIFEAIRYHSKDIRGPGSAPRGPKMEPGKRVH